MIIVPRRNLYLPERKWGQRKFQRGIICATAVYGVAVDVPDVTVGGAFASDTNSATTFETNDDAEAGHVFRSDGTIDRRDRINGNAPTFSQINVSTDWIIPNSEASGPETFHVRAIEVSSFEVDQKIGTMNTWLILTSDRTWYANRDRLAGNGTSQWVMTFSISFDGGDTTLASGIFTMNAEIDV